MMSPQNIKYAPYSPATGTPLFTDLPGDAHPRIFEIGLVLAGAVSAGAYTGGVLDFLFEALDALADNRANDGRGLHEVRLKVITGASAGGMTAAITAAAAKRRFPHIRTDNDAASKGADNPFYNAWVLQIDIRSLLDTADLAATKAAFGKPVLQSLLDCSVLDTIVTTTLGARNNDSADPPDRPWLADRVHLCFTTTNLRGVTYAFPFSGSQGALYSMTRHNDVARFSLHVRGSSTPRPDEIDLSFVPAGTTDSDWSSMGQAALATGAFPVALRARAIKPIAELYAASWFNKQGTATLTSSVKSEFTTEGQLIHLDDDTPSQPDLQYIAIDGGMINNEPLELARIELAGILGHNPQTAQSACRAVIMVDPFPATPDPGTLTGTGNETVWAVMGGMMTAFTNQNRFHPEDIRLALDESVYSRFMISPSGPNAKEGAQAIAGGALHGFSGFLDKSYRHHDFMLGRLNCYNFLKYYFTIPIPEPTDNSTPMPWLFSGEPRTLNEDLPPHLRTGPRHTAVPSSPCSARQRRNPHPRDGPSTHSIPTACAVPSAAGSTRSSTPISRPWPPPRGASAWVWHGLRSFPAA